MNRPSLRVATTNRFERRRERTRRDLLAAAVRVLAKKGLHDTKVADIAAAADIGVGTFYLHFPTKDALFDAVVEDTVVRLKATIDEARAAAPDAVARIRAANAAFCRFAASAGPPPPPSRPEEDVPMADAALRTPPEQDDQGESLPTSFDLHYTWRYEAARLELKNLYEKAKRDQWNATDQLPWSTDVDPEREIVPDIQIPVYGTHIWAKLTDADIRKLRREALSWTLSQFMHGEQGALLATAQIVDATPWIESKFYGATQVMDEARHVEVYSRYLREKLTTAYPVNRHLKSLLDQILTDSRWDMKYLGMQILVEGLAMAAFGYMHKMCQEPLLTELTHYVMRDESRHVAFGVLSLSEFYHDLPARELREREEFLYEGCRLMRDRLLMEDVWEVMGWPVDEVRQIVLESPQMKLFRQMLFSKVVPNVKRLGLLSPYVRERFAELDILQFENEEPSA